jgi:hypothetical protein
MKEKLEVKLTWEDDFNMQYCKYLVCIGKFRYVIVLKDMLKDEPMLYQPYDVVLKFVNSKLEDMLWLFNVKADIQSVSKEIADHFIGLRSSVWMVDRIGNFNKTCR